MSESQEPKKPNGRKMSWIDHIIWFCLNNKLVVALLIVFFILWGVMVAPFDWQIEWMPRNPVAVDAIPDIGENQQIVFTEWMGRSPQDVEDQITYPLTVSLLGIPGIAVSLDLFDPHADFKPAAQIANKLIHKIAKNGLPEKTFLNVNVPALPCSELKGIRITRQGKRIYCNKIVEQTDQYGRPCYWLGGDFRYTYG